ncbi:hypothetical protein O181_023710 [Austropuccinia psidii MF-1]|uniref:Uncharacterized protein n=1 Tax=Austropuccinia psidii MF-1 TaxID=1389203 RepID=A0A9Q3CJ25_9BASI|nr:hypothetical protein [Austropuccinia psidii MF-1]
MGATKSQAKVGEGDKSTAAAGAQTGRVKATVKSDPTSRGKSQSGRARKATADGPEQWHSAKMNTGQINKGGSLTEK